MRVWVGITTADGEVLERFAVLSGDVRSGPDYHKAIELQIARQLRDVIGRRFEVED